MKRVNIILFIFVLSISGCLKTQQQDEETQQQIAKGEGVAGETDTIPVSKPKPKLHSLGDSIGVQGVMYQVLSATQLSDTSRMLTNLPKSDSSSWIAVTIRCQNESQMHAAPHVGTLEIVEGADTVGYAAVLFRPTWKQTSLQPGECGEYVSVYKVPRSEGAGWLWHPGGRGIQGVSLETSRFRLK
jgi:hypothetical protein